jgi:RNA polymerase sigma factor (TIGR02999 family)
MGYIPRKKQVEGMQPITRLLLEWGDGSELALEQLTPLVYHELRKLAGGYLSRERSGHTLQPTALVHEAYLRLVEQKHQNWESRSHFFGVAAHLMRLILVDWARKARAGKRGAAARPVPLKDVAEAATGQRSEELIALDDALTDLSVRDPRKAKIIELRYFGGMTVDEVARSLSISTATVERETRFAQLWLCRELKGNANA